MGLKTAGSIPKVPLIGVSPLQESLDSPIDRRSDYYRQRAREQRPPGAAVQQAPLEPQPLLTVPNALTFLRVLLVPILVILWFHPARLAPLLAAITFIVAALTDWADGYLARKLRVTTQFGAFLDPVADKLMVCTALVLLAVSPPEPLSSKDLAIPAVIMIGRELTMSALREWAAASAGGAAHRAVKVNSLGKWKTALQLSAMSGMLLLHKAERLAGNAPEVLDALHWGARASLGLLWAGAFLAVWSLSNYMANVWVFFTHPSGLGSPVSSPRGAVPPPQPWGPPQRKKSM